MSFSSRPKHAVTTALFRQAGFTVVEMMMATAAMVFMALGAMTVLQMENQNNMNLGKYANIQMAKNLALQAFADDRAFKSTVDGNSSSFGCLVLANCTSGSGGNIVYFNAKKNPNDPNEIPLPVSMLANPANPTDGFNNQGAPCSTFDAQAGDDNCPFRYDVSWTPICDVLNGTPDCSNPTIRLSATLSYNPKTKTGMMPANLLKGFNVVYQRRYKSPGSILAQAACNMINGTIDANGACSTINNLVNVNCGTDPSTGYPSYPVGFTSTGTVDSTTCNPNPVPQPLPTQCPAGSIVNGITADGQYQPSIQGPCVQSHI